MPAKRLIAGMARSYGCPAKSFSDKFQTFYSARIKTDPSAHSATAV